MWIKKKQCERETHTQRERDRQSQREVGGKEIEGVT